MTAGSLEQTTQQLACSAELLIVAGTQSQRLLTKGSAEAKGAVRNFGRVHVDDTYYMLA